MTESSLRETLQERARAQSLRNWPGEPPDPAMLKEARLVAEAHSRGVPLEKLADRLLKEALTASSLLHGVLTVEESHHMLEGMAAVSEKPPNLSTESFSHESFCEDRLGRRTSSVATSFPGAAGGPAR